MKHPLSVCPHCGADSRRQRDVELLYLGQLGSACDHRAVLMSRHHACESMATFSLEGLMEEILTGEDHGRWLCEHVEFLVVPFVDKDGVEDGDQGKCRRPYDHWEDYGSESIYPTVRAIKQLFPEWSQGRLQFALDLHCPWIRGDAHEVIHFVGGPDEDYWQRVGHFCSILEEVRTGPLPYRVHNNLPFGMAWNVDGGPPRTCSRWIQTIPGIVVSTLVELPYANVEGATVTPETAQAFGRDLAHALRGLLERLEG